MKKKALILIVDDNAEYRELLMWTLEGHDFETISAHSGREAVELAIKSRPALVLMDLNMPGMDGYEATRAIHAEPHTRGIPVVAVSADCADYGFKRWDFKAGFITFLAKPWNPETLLEIVTNVLIGHGERTRAASILLKNEEFEDQLRKIDLEQHGMLGLTTIGKPCNDMYKLRVPLPFKPCTKTRGCAGMDEPLPRPPAIAFSEPSAIGVGPGTESSSVMPSA